MKWLANFPSTNARMVLSLILASVVVLVLTIWAMIMNRPVQEAVVYAVLSFLGLMMGLDVTQFSIKRKTTIVTPPEVMADNATAEMQVPVPSKLPKAGVAPSPGSEVRKGLEQLAASLPAKPVDPRLPSPLDDERD